MQTLTIDVINEKALGLLHELEALQLIRVRTEKQTPTETRPFSRHKGSMSKQPLAQVDEQFDELRNGWE